MECVRGVLEITHGDARRLLKEGDGGDGGCLPPSPLIQRKAKKPLAELANCYSSRKNSFLTPRAAIGSRALDQQLWYPSGLPVQAGPEDDGGGVGVRGSGLVGVMLRLGLGGT